MPEKKVIVKATAYNLKGTKGSISFKWKSTENLTPDNEKEFVAQLENIIGTNLEKQQL